MELDLVLQLIEDNGYLGLFFWLWFGIFGLPVPNEIIMMTVGLAASQNILNPFITFFVVLAGIIAALTTCYLSGRFVGRPLLRFFEKRKRFSNAIEFSLKMMDKHHAFSLSLSYFVPGIRSFVPFLYGFSKLPFRTFALFSYGGATVWLLLLFTFGYMFGDHIEDLSVYSRELFFIGSALLFVFICIKLIQRKRQRKADMLKEHSTSTLSNESSDHLEHYYDGLEERI